MKEVQACKLGRLLPKTHKNISKNNEKQVVAIPNYLPLSDYERSVHNKGLNFIPLEKSFHHFTVQPHVEAFIRRLLLQAYHHNQPNIKPTMQDEFLQIQTEDYKWTPNPGQCNMFDMISEQTRRELEPYFVPKPLKFSNIFKDERMAISSQKRGMTLLYSQLIKEVLLLSGVKINTYLRRKDNLLMLRHMQMSIMTQLKKTKLQFLIRYRR